MLDDDAAYSKQNAEELDEALSEVETTASDISGVTLDEHHHMDKKTISAVMRAMAKRREVFAGPPKGTYPCPYCRKGIEGRREWKLHQSGCPKRPEDTRRLGGRKPIPAYCRVCREHFPSITAYRLHGCPGSLTRDPVVKGGAAALRRPRKKVTKKAARKRGSPFKKRATQKR